MRGIARLPLIVLLASACGDPTNTGVASGSAAGASSAGGSSTPTAAARSTASTVAAPSASSSAAPGADRTLTRELMKQVILEVDFYEPNGDKKPIAPVLEQAKAKLGEPTFVDKGTWTWGVVNGDSCSYLLIEEQKGLAVTDGVQTIEVHSNPNPEFDKCLVKQGRKPEGSPEKAR